MKLPVKVWLGDIPGYTEAQMRQAIRDALEEAALVCDAHDKYPSLTPRHCAEAIRELKEQV